jgi:hypothetical protein
MNITMGGISFRQQIITATQFCEDWQEIVLDVWNCNQANISETEILGRMEKDKNLLEKLEMVYSTVRGVDGLLPMEAEVIQLTKVVLDALKYCPILEVCWVGGQEQGRIELNHQA